MSIYLLCDVGLSPRIAKKLYDNNITIDEIESNPECLAKIFGSTGTTKKNMVIEYIKEAKRLRDSESIYILYQYGLSESILNQIKEKNITLKDLKRETNFEEMKNKYDLGTVSTEKIYKALSNIDNTKYLIYQNDFSKEIINILYESDNTEFKIDELKDDKKIIGLDITFDDLKYSLKKLKKDNKIRFSEDLTTIQFLSLQESIDLNLKKDKWKEVFERSINGEYFSDVATDMSVTRENIRQIFNKCMSKIGKVKEDKYKESYEKYEWTPESFSDFYNVNKKVFYYLGFKYKLGQVSIEEILDNDNLTDKEKNTLKKHLRIITYKNYTISANRLKFIDIILKTENRVMNLKEILSFYNKIVEDYKFETIPGMEKVEEKSTNLIAALLDRSEFVVQSNHNQYRYYDYKILAKSDIQLLENMLNVEDGIYSARKFYEENLMLMQSLDIQNQYELHNILRKVISNSKISFGRMPDIYIGETDKTEFLIKLINRLSPINVDDFCKMMENDYGHIPSTMYAYLYNYLNEFITNNILDTKLLEFNNKELSILSEQLNKNIYSISEINKIIADYTHKDGVKYLNNLNFSRLGYKVREQYIFKQDIGSIDDYVKKTILKDNFYIESDELKKLGSSYIWTISLMLINKEIFKIADNMYITKKGIEEKGISVEKIENTETKIKNSIKENEVFNIYILKKKNTINKEDFFGFSESFLENILQYSKGIQLLRIEGNYLFVKSEKNYNKSKFVNSILNKICPIKVDDSLKFLKDNYNIEIDKYTILSFMDRNIYTYDSDTKIIKKLKEND